MSILLVVLAAFLFLLAPFAFAGERGLLIESQSGWVIHPYVTFYQYYDDNPSRDPDDEKRDDYISIGRTGFRVKSPHAAEGRRFRFYTDFYGDWLIFANRDIKGIRPAFDVIFDYISGTGVEMNIADAFAVTNEPPNNEVTGLDLNIENDAFARIKYSFAKLAISIAYRNLLLDYLDRDDINHMTHIITPAGYVKITPKLEFFAEYSYGIVDYERHDTDHSDAKYHQIQAGFNWKATPKIDTTIKAGYQRRDYDDPARGDYAGWVGSLDINWNILQELGWLVLTIKRDLVESIYQDNNYYISNGGGVRFRHWLGERWRVSLEGFWFLDQYPEPTIEDSETRKRQDQTWWVGADVDFYIIPGLSVGVGYVHRCRDSNHNVFDYVENRVEMIQVAAVF